MKILMLATTILLTSACVFEKSKVEVDISPKISSINVTSVSLLNNQIIISGNNLNIVQNFKINGTSFNEVFTIQSKSSTQIIADANRAFSFDFSKAFEIILSNANGSATFPITFDGYWNKSGNDINYVSGKVGIGTASPTAKLQVTGSIPGESQELLVSQETSVLSLNTYSPTFASTLYAGNSLLYTSGKMLVRSDGGEINFYLSGGSNYGYRHARIIPGGLVVGTYDQSSTTYNGSGYVTAASIGSGFADGVGAHLALRGGAGTGSGAGGSILFSTTPPSTTGSTVNAWAERMRINSLGNVGIGTASPGASSILDIASTTKGVVLPRMTKAQRDLITTMVAGMTIYQTDNTPGLRVYNGVNWMRFTETID